MNNQSEEQFLLTICNKLDESTAHLDSTIAHRLNAMRQAALAINSNSKLDTHTNTLLDGAQRVLNKEDALEAEIEKRLDLIRQRAIAQLNDSKTTPLPSTVRAFAGKMSAFFDPSKLFYPSQALATVCITLTVVSLFYFTGGPTIRFPVDSEFELIASADDIELYENLEFYLWLAENELSN